MNKLILTAVIFCYLFVSCKKSEDKPCYGLVSPINDPSDVSPFFIRFSWLNCSNMSAQFVLSAYRDFSKPIRIADTFSTSLVSDTVLYPLTTYYWIVTVHGQDESYADSFTTTAVSPIVSGTYAGKGRNRNYAFIGDTTYPYQLTVKDAGNDKISLQLPGIDTVVFSKIYTTDTTVVYTCRPCTGKYAGYKSLTYFPISAAIEVIFQTDAVNFDEWDFNGGKPVF